MTERLCKDGLGKLLFFLFLGGFGCSSLPAVKPKPSVHSASAEPRGPADLASADKASKSADAPQWFLTPPLLTAAGRASTHPAVDYTLALIQAYVALSHQLEERISGEEGETSFQSRNTLYGVLPKAKQRIGKYTYVQVALSPGSLTDGGQELLVVRGWPTEKAIGLSENRCSAELSGRMQALALQSLALEADVTSISEYHEDSLLSWQTEKNKILSTREWRTPTTKIAVEVAYSVMLEGSSRYDEELQRLFTCVECESPCAKDEGGCSPLRRATYLYDSNHKTSYHALNVDVTINRAGRPLTKLSLKNGIIDNMSAICASQDLLTNALKEIGLTMKRRHSADDEASALTPIVLESPLVGPSP